MHAASVRWRASRVDAAESTKRRHGLELEGIRRVLGDRRVDLLEPGEVADFVAALVAAGYARGTIRKTLQTLAMVFEHAGVTPNPARDKRVRLPREEPVEINPPTAEHLETVFHLLPSRHRPPLLWLDWSGARVPSIDLTLVGDYDEPRRRIRCAQRPSRHAGRCGSSCTRRWPWHSSSAWAARGSRPRGALVRGVRSGCSADGDCEGCRAAGIPLFSPPDLRHRRISLLHLRGVPWARIGEHVGQRSLSVTADTYSHVLVDERELEYENLLA